MHGIGDLARVECDGNRDVKKTRCVVKLEIFFFQLHHCVGRILKNKYDRKKLHEFVDNYYCTIYGINQN
jgi:hypothetical protein